MPAVGFAMGMERLLLLLEQVGDNTPVRDCEVFLVADPASQGKALVLAEQIRDQLEAAGSNIRLKVGSQGSMKSQMKKPIRPVLYMRPLSVSVNLKHKALR